MVLFIKPTDMIANTIMADLWSSNLQQTHFVMINMLDMA